ncbi:class I SAM-dependent methyltransferase [Paludisphaera rhizosphaerae]|uniref:class I SAM-dependent methyltransferase n=1 Tax=Paludisphaera rhizosphaerae TaxID=2711216 RepID=UPI0013EAE103|nr:class I SAM-dependent methyltransferase [Paludisphaera rhizosphaerae]
MTSYENDARRSTQVRRVRGADGSDAEFDLLTTEDGLALLAEVQTVKSPGPADVTRWRKRHAPEVVAAALRLAEARRKGAVKYSRSDRMWLDPVGVEQATAEIVAEHKARRFQADVVVDLCSGIGGDAVALAARSNVLAVDRDRGMARRVAWNADAYDRGGRVLPCQSTAEAFPIPAGAWVHIDPDRRTSGKGRAVAAEGYVPGPEFLHQLIRTAPAGAIKLGPASDFAGFVANLPCEVEIISLDGEAKEATVWFGAAATASRRATKLPEAVTWTDRMGEPSANDFPAVAPAVGRWLYDPDPALSRSGLLDSFARAHGLGRIAADLPYLTADVFLATPWLEAFEVLEVHPLDLKKLRRQIDASSLGPVQVKHKTTDLKPEALRPLLRPKGDAPAVLFLTGGAGPGRAFVTRRPGITPTR